MATGGSQFKVDGQTHYQRNKQLYIDRTKERRQELRDFVNQLKDKPCTDCGIKFHPAAMDFDHLNNKEFEISKMILNGRSKEAILKEIAKCELVCSNCHRVRTFNRLQE